MAIPYAPTTDEGTGFLVSLFKAAHHMHNITVATAYGWKITVEQARAEIDHITGHANEALRVINEETPIIAEQSLAYIRDWHEQTQAQIRAKLTELENANPAKELPKGKEFRESLKTLEQQTWALLAFLDQDLLGLPEVPDAGRKP